MGTKRSLHYDKLLTKSTHVSPEELKIKKAANEPVEDEIDSWDVKESLRKCGKSAPGPDGITFFDLKVFDRKGIVLAAIFNSAMELRTVPKRWKSSVTTLIPKGTGGDRLDLDKRRPITCQQAIHKVYTGIIAARLETWCTAQNLISEEQTGFKKGINGCLRNTFTVSEVMNAGGHTMFADITKAFNTIPHDHIMRILCDSGAGYLQEVILNCYAKVTTRFRTGGGLTNEVRVNAGILQGCRLSPILFNLCIQPVIDALNEQQELGFEVSEKRRCCVAFADDFCIISKTKSGLQKLVDIFNRTIQAIGLKLNFNKCFVSKVKDKKSTPVKIDGRTILEVSEEDVRSYLGAPIPFSDKMEFADLLASVLSDTKAIDRSHLLPWQKIDCLNMFVMSRLPFYLQLIGHTKSELDKVDRAIRAKVKDWLGIHKTSNNRLCSMSRSEGGAGMTPIVILDAVAKLTTALQTLNCEDQFVRCLARSSLSKATKPGRGTAPGFDQLLEYLNKKKNNAGVGKGLWPNVAKSVALINGESNDLKVTWLYQDDEFKLKLVRGRFEETYDSSNARMAHHELKQQLRIAWLYEVESRSSTWAYTAIAKHPCSNKPLYNDGLSLSDYYFVQKARSQTLATRARLQLYTRVETTRCRICKNGYENVYHELNGCDSNIMKA